jgi:hypothetical protein
MVLPLTCLGDQCCWRFILTRADPASGSCRSLCTRHHSPAQRIDRTEQLGLTVRHRRTAKTAGSRASH